jgi:cardiolipin synthase
VAPRDHLTIPNLLTAGRIGLVPAVIACLATGRATLALWLFVGAAVTDVLDGLLARILHQSSALGEWLDPLADKLLVFSVFMAMTLLGAGGFPVWFTAIVLGRDAFISLGIGALSLAGRHVVVNPTRLSKYATFFQMATLSAALVYQAHDRAPGVLAVLRPIMVMCLVLSIVSVVQYTWRGVALLRRRPG